MVVPADGGVECLEVAMLTRPTANLCTSIGAGSLPPKLSQSSIQELLQKHSVEVEDPCINVPLPKPHPAEKLAKKVLFQSNAVIAPELEPCVDAGGDRQRAARGRQPLARLHCGCGCAPGVRSGLRPGSCPSDPS